MNRKIYLEDNGEVLGYGEKEFVILEKENSEIQRNKGIQIVRDNSFEKVATELFTEENPKTNIINVYGSNSYLEIKKFRDATAQISKSIFDLQTLFLGFISMESFENIFWQIGERLEIAYKTSKDTFSSRLRPIEVTEQGYNVQYCSQNLGFYSIYPRGCEKRYQGRVKGEEANNINESIKSLKKAFLHYDTKVFCALGIYKEDEKCREILKWFVEHPIPDFMIIIDSGENPIKF